MKKLLITSMFTFTLLIGLSENANSYMLDCEDLYDTCIENNPYDIEEQFFIYYGYQTGCSTSRNICNDLEMY
ncbi:MAG: hypothetical protein ABJI33_02795 [Balneola sp.]